jgi:uncharacterized protein
MFNLASGYAHGNGVEKDDTIALRIYQESAAWGDPSAKFALGNWYKSGRGGLPVDWEKSFELQLQAAEMGHEMAMYNVGVAYFTGNQGTEKNFPKAAEWFQRAADKYVTEAGLNLGFLYRRGLGVRKDLRKAKEIYKKFAPVSEVASQLLVDIDIDIEQEKNKSWFSFFKRS